MRKLLGSSQTVVLVLRTKVFAKTVLEHYSRTMFTKTVRILRRGFKRGARLSSAIPLCQQEQQQLTNKLTRFAQLTNSTILAVTFTQLVTVPLGVGWRTVAVAGAKAVLHCKEATQHVKVPGETQNTSQVSLVLYTISVSLAHKKKQ